MSKKMPLKVFAAKYRWNPKEEEWILKNDKDDHYYNNSALKSAWSSLSYPIYDGDYYFAFIHDNNRINAKYNAEANRELRKYIKSFLNADEIFDKMQDYFKRFRDAGSGDTMTREELWTAIVDMRRKNPAPKKPTNESVEDLNEAKKLKDIVRKHKSALMKAKRSGNLELPQKVEDELSNWASNNGDIHGDDPDEFIDWLDTNLDDLVPTLKIRESVNENYRKLAQFGMGTETSKSARVGLELDFYDSKGNKKFGKILQKTNTGYLVKDDKGKKHELKYLDRKKAQKMLKPNYVHTESLEEQGMGDKIGKLFKTKDKKEIDGIANLMNMTSVKVLQSMMKQNPKGFKRMAKKMGELPAMEEKEILDSFELNEVTDKEINMAKKLSKDMQKVKQGYIKIARTGDKTLNSAGFNDHYESILKAQQKVLSLIGELTTMKQISDRGASRKKDAQGRPIMSSNIMDSYREMREDELQEESITYQLKVKNKNGPEYKKFEKSARMMKLKMSSKMNAGNKMVAIVDGTKKNLRDFDSVVRGRQSYGDPSTIKHFDEK